MDVINKFYSSMQTTVSQLSGVLPGNNVTREYEILNEIGSAGVGMHWRVYNGIKKTTKQTVSVFVFEKKKLDKWTREDRDSLLQSLRRGVQQLTKIKHPHILTVQHPLEESRDSLAFATEPIISSLCTILGDTNSPVKLFGVEIVHGFRQLIDALNFLHSDAQILHGNLSPECVIINKHRSWKLFGFDFYIRRNEVPKVNNTFGNRLAQPTLEYMAPEILRNEENTPESDLYSLGMLMYCACTGRNLQSQTWHQYGQEMQPFTYPMDTVPYNLRSILKSLIHPNPTCRPKLQELIHLQPFQELEVKTLNYLDTLFQWDNLQKSKFYKGLIKIVPNFPHQVNIHSVIPQLVKEFVNLPMVPFVLPNVLLIAKMSTQQEYTEFILPHLKMVFMIEDPIQVLLILMQEMDILLNLTPSSDVKEHVLPLLYRSMESDMVELQQLSLQALPSMSSAIGFSEIKNSVMLRVKKLCLKSTDVTIKVKCLLCIGKLIEHLDKWVLLSDVLPFLEQIHSREPAIIMAIIGIHKIALTDPKLGITAEVMATKCIPFLMPLCLENSLSIPQFTSVITIIKEMFRKVEKEQRLKLEQLSVINADIRNASSHESNLLPLQEHHDSKRVWTPADPTVGMENSDSSIFNVSTHSNPLVLNRQLTTPTFASNCTTGNENYACENPPINYIYNNRFKENQMQNPKSSGLVSLTQQDILNFLK